MKKPATTASRRAAAPTIHWRKPRMVKRIAALSSHSGWPEGGQRYASERPRFFPALFSSQGFSRIDARDPQCGQEACDGRDAHQHQGYADKRQRIVGSDTVDCTFHYAEDEDGGCESHD